MLTFKWIIATVLVLALSIQSAYGGQISDVKKGQPAPHDGVLFDPDEANKVKRDLIDKDTLEKINESYKKSMDLYKSNEEILQDQKKRLMDQNVELTRTLNDTRQTSDLTKILYFVLGVTLTGAAVYGASRLNR